MTSAIGRIKIVFVMAAFLTIIGTAVELYDWLSGHTSIEEIRNVEMSTEAEISRILSRTSHNACSDVSARYDPEIKVLEVKIITDKPIEMLVRSDIYDTLKPLQKRFKNELFFRVIFCLKS